MAKEEKTTYRLGNTLRGTVDGMFASEDEAWSVLSERFNNTFPSRNGRLVEMTKVVRFGITAGGNETPEDKVFREEVERQLNQS